MTGRRLAACGLGLGVALGLAACASPPPPPAARPALTPPAAAPVVRWEHRRPPPPSPERPRLGPLDAFYDSLDALERGEIPSVTVIQLGDSHTAGDRFSGRLRELFQARFGNAGRGMLPPGVPYDGFRPTQVAVSATGWRTVLSWPARRPGPFGLAGVQATGQRPTDLMAIEPRDEGGFDRLMISFARQPQGGALVVRADGAEVMRMPTAGAAPAGDLVQIPLGRSVRRIELAPAGDGPVTVLGWATERNAPGVIWDSHGISGSTASVLDRFDPDLMGRELLQRAPSLIILAYGTNEGFEDGLVPETYAADLERQINRLREMTPGVSILLIGPPDAERLPDRCPGAMRSDVRYECAPLTPAEEQAYTQMFKAKKPAPAACRWHAPPRLAQVRDIQARIAAKTGVGLWDWSALMGTQCGTHRWTRAEPPLARLDHVHLTQDGYQRSAEALFTTLMDGYTAWTARPRPPLPPAQPLSR